MAETLPIYFFGGQQVAFHGFILRKVPVQGGMSLSTGLWLSLLVLIFSEAGVSSSRYRTAAVLLFRCKAVSPPQGPCTT